MSSPDAHQPVVFVRQSVTDMLTLSSFSISGHSRPIEIKGCVSFHVTTNACRGYCVSYAFPSLSKTRLNNPYHIITSKSRCCSISKTHDVSTNCKLSFSLKTSIFVINIYVRVLSTN